MEEPWELLGVLGPMSSQSDSNVVWGFEALEAKKVRTDFNFFFTRESLLLNRDGDSFTCLTFEGLKGCMGLPTKAFAIPCCSRKLYL